MSHSHAQVVFYSLSRKFVQEKKAPAKAQEVIYYSLAIGHHLGVIDCLEAKLSCPLAGFHGWVAQLPADYRQLFDLIYLNGYTQKEAAEVINIPVGTVKTRLRAALRGLKSKMTSE